MLFNYQIIRGKDLKCSSYSIEESHHLAIYKPW